MNNRRMCFIIMPFLPELHYFYLFLQKHLQENHNIECERADHKVLTIPLLEKIKGQILDADVIIADITGRNANVFYELGLAHALRKKVILITCDAIEEAPSDIRHYEFIQYDLQGHVYFLSKLDNALHYIFIEYYKDFYKEAIKFLKGFNKGTGLNCKPISQEIFQKNFLMAERTKNVPDKGDKKRLKAFLLPLIVEDSREFAIMKSIVTWISE